MTKTKIGAGGGEKAPWMPKYGRDFYGDENVEAMTWEQRGIYDFLLWKAWDEGSIPADAKKLARMCSVPPRRFAKIWADIAPCWRPHASLPGRLVQKRQERVRAASGELSRRMKELADRRWAAQADAREAAGQAQPTDHDAEPDATPHSDHACDDACEPACGPALRPAMLTTSHTPDAIATGDGGMDGGRPGLRNQKGEGYGTRGPRDAGAGAARIAAEARP